MEFYSLLDCCSPLLIGGLDINEPVRNKIQKEFPELKLSLYTQEETERLEEYLLSHDRCFMLPIVEALLNKLLNGLTGVKDAKDADLFYVEASYIIAINGVFKIVEKYRIELGRDFMNVWKDNGYFQFFTTGLNLAKKASTALPKEFESEDFKSIIKKGMEKGLIESSLNGLKWNETKGLLAYFAERISQRYKLSKKKDKDGNDTISWKPFEDLFGVEKLKDAKQNRMKIYTQFTPNGYEDIDKLLD